MSVTRPVVLAWDASPGARIALEWAARAAVEFRRPLRVVFVPQPPDPTFAAYEVPMEIRAMPQAEVDEILTRAAELVARVAPGLDIETTSMTGHPVSTLTEMSADAEMLVLGSRGHNRIAAALLGSTSLAVASHADCPVVVVRDHASPGEEAPVTVGTDGSETSAEAIRFAARYADAVGAPLRVVTAMPDASHVMADLVVPPEYLDSLREEAAAFAHEALGGLSEDYPDLDITVVVSAEPAPVALQGAAETSRLLVVGSHGRGGFLGMLLGSVSRSTLASAAGPVAVVRHHAAASRR